MEEELRQTAMSRYIQGGESPKDVYTSLNRSKKWFFKWLIRYRTGGPDWFKEQSRAPKTKPSEIDVESKERILLTRQQHCLNNTKCLRLSNSLLHPFSPLRHLVHLEALRSNQYFNGTTSCF